MSPEESHPLAQQRLHALTVLFAGLTIARSFILPAAVGGISAARRDVSDAAMWIALIAGIPSLIGAVAKYMTFRYHLANDALVIDSGVLQKQHRVIPLASVQNIGIRETALQRAFGVATLTVETAMGGVKADAEFAVLRRETAEALRKDILARHARPVPDGPDGLKVRALPEFPAAARETLITHLAPGDLVVAGATANHAGLIVAALAGALQLADDLPYLSWASRQLDRLPFDTVSAAILVGLGIIAILLVVGWVVSIVGSVVGYYDFTLTCSDDQLHKSHGLLGRHRAIVPLKRVQAVRIEESILRRPLALAALRVTTAGTATRQQESGGAETIAPLARAPDIPRLVAAIFPALNYGGIALSPVHVRSRSRTFTQYSVVLLALIAAVSAWSPSFAIIPALLLFPAWLLAAWQYRNRGFATVGGYVVARNGVLNRITWLVPDHKLQTLHLRESPFQRRHGLASVVLDTAGGGGHASVRDLLYDDAARLIDSLRPERVASHLQSRGRAPTEVPGL